MKMYFTDEERATLERLVNTALQEIRVEVRHTHDSEAKTELKHRENVLRSISDKVAVEAPAVVNV